MYGLFRIHPDHLKILDFLPDIFGLLLLLLGTLQGLSHLANISWRNSTRRTEVYLIFWRRTQDFCRQVIHAYILAFERSQYWARKCSLHVE